MLLSRFAIFACLLTAISFVSDQATAQSTDKGSANKSTTQGSVTKTTDDEGFISLLDKSDMSHFRGYKKDKISSAWTVTDNVLRVDGVKRGDDIMTKKSYQNFDLRFEWKVSEAGNSGVFYHVGLGDSAAYKTGIEYQVLDNDGHKDGKSKLTSAGSIYALYPPKAYPKKKVGEWNKARIVCNGTKIQHYLNDVLVAEADTSSDDWKKHVAASKFKDWKRFASQSKGHIAFQDHGDEVWFQKIKIKALPDTPMVKPAAAAGSGSTSH